MCVCMCIRIDYMMYVYIYIYIHSIRVYVIFNSNISHSHSPIRPPRKQATARVFWTLATTRWAWRMVLIALSGRWLPWNLPGAGSPTLTLCATGMRDAPGWAAGEMGKVRP